MKRSKKLALLFAVLFLLGSLYSLITLLAPDEDQVEETGTVLANVDAAAVTRMDWTFEGEENALVKSGDTWQDGLDAKFPLDVSFATAMLNAVETLKATVTIRESGDLAQYGLAEPACTVKLTTKDGGETRLSIGDQNSLTKDYYVLYQDDPSVYTMDAALYTAFAHKRLDLVEKEALPELSDMKLLRIEGADAVKTLTYLEDNAALSYSSSYPWFWTAEDGTQKALASDKVKTLTDHLANMKWDACVDYAMTDPAKYGLDQPTLTVKINYVETVSVDTGEKDSQGNAVTEEKSYDQNMTLLIGAVSGGSHYAALDGSKMVYTIDSSVASALLAAEYVNLRPDDICAMDWDTVDSMDLVLDGKEHTIHRFGAESNADGTVRYSLDNRAMDGDSVQAFLDALNALESSGEADTVKTGAAAYRITFHRTTEKFGTMVWSLADYDDRNYLLTFDGESRLLVAKKDIASLMETFDAIHETTTTTAETEPADAE